MLATKNFNKNWLLYTTVIFLIVGQCINYVYKGKADLWRIPAMHMGTLYLLLFSVFVVPVVEEISHRGLFTKSKWIRILSYGGLILMTCTGKDYYLLPIVICLVIWHWKAKDKQRDIFLLVSAIVFAVMHYQPKDLLELATIAGVFIKISIAFLLTWLVCNFNIVYSMIVHSIINCTVYATMILPYEFSPKISKEILTENYRISIKQVSFFTKKQSLATDGRTFLRAENTDMTSINSLLCGEKPTLILGKYDVVIERKRNSKATISCAEMDAIKNTLTNFIVE